MIAIAILLGAVSAAPTAILVERFTLSTGVGLFAGAVVWGLVSLAVLSLV